MMMHKRLRYVSVPGFHIQDNRTKGKQTVENTDERWDRYVKTENGEMIETSCTMDRANGERERERERARERKCE